MKHVSVAPRNYIPYPRQRQDGSNMSELVCEAISRPMMATGTSIR